MLRSAVRHRVWATDTGIDPVWMRPNPLCCVPLPLYPENWPPGLRRWPRARGAMMWHPPLWLPDRLATRYLLDDDGVCTPEPDDVWCLRVCLELQAAGLYDTDTGTWVDVLSLAGLNGNDPDTAGRVERWLAGTPDPPLDRLDLTEHVDRPGDLDWALHAAIDELPAMRLISWVLTALDLLDACEALTAGGDDGLERVRRSGSTIARLAETNLATIPDRDNRGLAMATDDGVDPESVWWHGVRRRLRQVPVDAGPVIDAIVREMTDRLNGIVNTYEPDAAVLDTGRPVAGSSV